MAGSVGEVIVAPLTTNPLRPVLSSVNEPQVGSVNEPAGAACSR
jgi:hypothetical protein